MRRPIPALAGYEQTVEGLIGYEEWQLRQGREPSPYWRRKITATGLVLPPMPRPEQGDAFEEEV